MYNLVTAYTRSYDRSVGVQELDVSDVNIRDLISDNSEVYLVLTSEFLTGNHVLNLTAVHSDIFSRSPELTVSGWLVDIGSMTLPTAAGTISTKEVRVKSMDAMVGGFMIMPSSGNLVNDGQDTLPEDRADIVLLKTGTDYNLMRSQMLVSCNGYLHMTDSDVNAMYVKDAADTMRIGKSPKLTLHSFNAVSNLNLIPMANCTITPRNQVDLEHGVTITTDVSLTGKTVWLSVGGHLLYLNRGYQVVNDRSIYLDWGSLNIHHKYMLAKRYIDLSTVDAAMLLTDNATGIIDRQVLNSNAAIEAYLNLSQSFLIVIDNPSVDVIMTRLEDTGLPGKYLVYDNPYTMFLSGDGRIPSCSLIDEHKAWVVSTSIDAGMMDTYIGDTIPTDQTTLFTATPMKTKRHMRTPLYSLDIVSTILTVN